MKKYNVSFPGTTHDPAVLHEGDNLSERLSVRNSPLLFGCRAGICGTCLIEIESGWDELTPPQELEREALDIYAPGNAKARLACQIAIDANIAVRKIKAIE
jgi:ferredoxin